MRAFLRRILFVIVAVVLLVGITPPSVAVANRPKATSPKDLSTVTQNVKRQFQSMFSVDNTFDRNADIKLARVLFSPEEDVDAYLFDIIQAGQKAGYLIANSDPSNRIIEYGKELFLDVAAKEAESNFKVKKTKQKVYYLGGLDYVISGKDNMDRTRYLDTAGGVCEETNQEKIKSVYKSNRERISSDETPDSENVHITNPSLYENWYDEYREKDVKNYNLSYFIMSDFSKGGVCAPTAATNLFYYWYNRDPKYKKVLISSWKHTFNCLYTYMECDSTGAYNDMVAPGIRQYMRQCKCEGSAKFTFFTDYGKKLIPELNADRPCVLIIKNHTTYHDHAALALGYRQYVYKGFWRNSYETYIRIADGWIRQPYRYVWGGCKGSWDYVKVEIK